ncbi:MAG TPA: flagellar biosynthesis protein FliQ [Anaerolineaceae bacterium]|nr:flagellar biosynthesis protein FliQ [Anaerolineaceae bacterium]HPN52812.1 flagellar biosynthesis protein FliQ [Anaerolineaceae bacterium]
MDEAFLITFAENALMITVILITPFLLVSLVVGSVISLLQAATQVNEVTLTFVPKVIGMILVVVLLGSWLGERLLAYTANVFSSLPNLVR